MRVQVLKQSTIPATTVIPVSRISISLPYMGFLSHQGILGHGQAKLVMERRTNTPRMDSKESRTMSEIFYHLWATRWTELDCDIERHRIESGKNKTSLLKSLRELDGRRKIGK